MQGKNISGSSSSIPGKAFAITGVLGYWGPWKLVHFWYFQRMVPSLLLLPCFCFLLISSTSSIRCFHILRISIRCPVLSAFKWRKSTTNPIPIHEGDMLMERTVVCACYLNLWLVTRWIYDMKLNADESLPSYPIATWCINIQTKCCLLSNHEPSTEARVIGYVTLLL